MFILNLKYIKSLDSINEMLEAHIKYLDKYYSLKKFICSGRKEPRVGGIIVCNAKDKEEVKAIIEEDPFYVKKIAEYEIIEFIPTKYTQGFEQFINL